MKTRITIILSILIYAFLLQSCSVKKKAKGSEDEIFVIADSSEYLLVENELKETF